jgi:putative serine protease PepD
MTDGGQGSDDGTARPAWPVSDAEAEPDAEREYRPAPAAGGGTRWTQPSAPPRGRHGLMRSEGPSASAETPPVGLRRPDATPGWREAPAAESGTATSGEPGPGRHEPARETSTPAPSRPEAPAVAPFGAAMSGDAGPETTTPVPGHPETLREAAPAGSRPETPEPTSGDAAREPTTPAPSRPEAPEPPPPATPDEAFSPPEAPAAPFGATTSGDAAREPTTPAPSRPETPEPPPPAVPDDTAREAATPAPSPAEASSAFARPDSPDATHETPAPATEGWGPPDATTAQHGDTVWAHPPREPSAFGGPATSGQWGRPDEAPASPWAPQAATGASSGEPDAGDTVWAHVPRPIGDKPDVPAPAPAAPPGPSPWGPPTTPHAAAGPPATFTQPDEPRPEGYQPVDAVPPAAWNADIGTPAPPGPPPVKPKRRRRAARGIAIAAACLLAGALGGAAAVELREDDFGGGQTVSLPPVPAVDVDRPADSVAGVARTVLPTVVAIKVRAGADNGTGSGFVIDPQGYILTNNHVVTAGGNTPSSRIDVVFQDGTQVQAQLVGRDDSYDLAVLKVNVKGLRAVQLGNSDGVVVGDPVVAIGAPLGLRGTVTTGIVSALNRPVSAGEGDAPAFINAIQTDAAINPGNSGGPLVDGRGRVIGVNSAIARVPGLGATAGSGSIGLGFAIPSNQARRTADELIRTGKAEHPIIGVVLDRDYEGEGVQVSTTDTDGNPPVTPGGPAARAGIRAGDIITKFNNRPVTEPDELIVAIRAERPGDTVKLTIRRGSSERVVDVVLRASQE